MLNLATCLRSLCLILTIAFATPALAKGPEQFYEPGPGNGGTRLEYDGQIGVTTGTPRAHSAELFHGVSDRLAIGIEVEGGAEDSRFSVEDFGLGAIVGLTRKDAPVEAAIMVQAGITTTGSFPQLETRLLLKHRRGPANLLANVIIRRVDDIEQGASLGYAASAHFDLADGLALGAEASGQAARLAGYDLGFETAHFVGPSLMVSKEAGNAELNFGVRYLRRIDPGAGYRDTVRLNFSYEF